MSPCQTKSLLSGLSFPKSWKKIVLLKVQNLQSFKVRLLTIFTKVSFHVEDIRWVIGPKSGKIMSSSLKKIRKYISRNALKIVFVTFYEDINSNLLTLYFPKRLLILASFHLLLAFSTSFWQFETKKNFPPYL